MNKTSAVAADTLAKIVDDVRTAARALIPDATQIVMVPGHPNLARVSSPSGDWCVRRWPEATAANDVTFSHQVMGVARSAGLIVVPTLYPVMRESDGPILRLARYIYDAQAWMPGDPARHAEIAWPQPNTRLDLPIVLAPNTFSEAVTAIARVHEATMSLATGRDIPTAPLQMLPGAVRQAQAGQIGVLRSRARYEPAIQRWIVTGERLIASAEPIVLAATEGREWPASVLHLNLWPAHILIDDGTLSGLLGWERVAAGSPLLDIAQTILRLQGWTDESVEVALCVYGEVRELAPDERRLLPAVAALDVVATTGRLLEKTYAVTETRPPTALRTAIDMMLRSMSALDRNLNAPSEKSRRRVWNRQMPRPGSRARGGTPRERRR
jgi:hypothetical protein